MARGDELAEYRAKRDLSQSGWLPVKKYGEGADRRRRPAQTQPESVLSGHTYEELTDE